MRIHLIKKQTIQNYVVSHASGKSSFENWLTAIKYADWETPDDIRQTFRSADLLGNGSNRVVFDIGGNNYRMICNIIFWPLRFTCLFAGSAHIQNTINFVTMDYSLLLMRIKFE
jgi:mRNA interferase HigB